MGKQASKMKPTNFTELAEQTSFLQDDLIEWYKGFVIAYPNKALSIEDFKKIYGDIFPFGDATQFARHVFRQFDSNGDRNIDFREFVLWLSVTISGTTEERLHRAFTMYDLDGNGYISREEMMEIVQSIYKMVGIVNETKSEKRVDEIFGKLDVDADGRLSMTEFVEGMTNDPALMKLLQCDWEMRFLETFGNTTSATQSSKTPLSTQLLFPLHSPPKSYLSKKTSTPVGQTTHKPLIKQYSTPTYPNSSLSKYSTEN